ncbi:MAG: LD-carboxypeptidase, partial [Myxococcota bacterium]
SDATALLAWAQVTAGVRGIHGPMAAQLGELPDDDVAWLFRMMEDTEPAGRLPTQLTGIGRWPDKPAAPVEGALAGGNLCLLSHLLSTPYCPNFAGRILMLEEVGERPYRLDRYLTHLGLAGVLDAVAGVLLGDLEGCGETVHADHPEPLAVVDERLRRYRVPGLSGLHFGHGQRNLALPLSARCRLDLAAGTLSLLEPAVAAH